MIKYLKLYISSEPFAMKRSTLLFTLLFGCVYNSICQTQLTHIENYIQDAQYTNKGIVEIEGNNYLLETNDYTLRVSIIRDSIDLLYVVSDYPDDDTMSFFNGNFDTRSGFIVDSIFLYEIFKHQIRKRNIFSGEITDTYSFSGDEIKYLSGVNVVDNFIHIQNYIGNRFSFYNITSKDFTSLPFSRNQTQRFGNNYYTKISGNDGVSIFNTLDGSTTQILENQLTFQTSTNNSIEGHRGMIISGISKTTFVNQDTSILLNCSFSSLLAPEIKYYDSEVNYFVFSIEDYETTFSIINKEDCSLVNVQKFEAVDDNAESVKVFDYPLFNEDYLLFAINYLSHQPCQLYLLDKNDLTLTLIDDQNIQRIYTNSFYKSGNDIYFIGHGASEPYPPIHLYSLNLTDKNLKLDNSNFCDGRPISFGPSIQDSTYLLSGASDKPLCVHKYKNHTDSQLINNEKNTRNAGLTEPIYLANSEDKLVFRFINEIYLVDHNSALGDETQLITQCSNISQLLINGDMLEGLINIDQSTYHLKYNLTTNILNTNPLDIYVASIENCFSSSKYIFGLFSVTEKIYFDNEKGNFESIPINNNITAIRKSNSNVLFLHSTDTGYTMTSFIDGDFIASSATFINKPSIVSKGNGEFFIIENLSGLEKQISLVKSDGSIGDKIVFSGNLLEYNQDNIETGPLSAFMAYNASTENFELIMHRYDNFHRYIIPFLYASSFPIIWYKAGSSIILKSEDENESGIYICTIGKEPKRIELNDLGLTNYKLLFATHNDGVVSFMVDSSPDNLEIVQYNVETGNLLKYESEIDDLSYDWYSKNKSFRISNTLYYTTFVNEPRLEVYENSEFYIFDEQNLTFESGPDINQNTQISNPHRFIESPSYLYFIARSPQDNSYQLFSIQKDQITSVKEFDDHQDKINVFPNPSSDFISLGIEAQSIHISDSNGQVIKRKSNYSKDEKIDISELEQGIYYLEIFTKSNIFSSNFIKI